MILFFRGPEHWIYATGTQNSLTDEELKKLSWLFGNAELIDQEKISGTYLGPRKEMITPWSTNAVEITQNMGIEGIERIEQFQQVTESNPDHDPMLQHVYDGIDQNLFTIHHEPEPLIPITDIRAYNEQEGLALSEEEINYLEDVSRTLKRNLTDSEVFGFSQVNSEHCRHKIFNGTFIIDGEEQPYSLFQLIRKTSERNPNKLVSAYKDNVAFIKGPRARQFAPQTQDKADYFEEREIETVLSLKAETHNFPTTVEPFNGAATGTGGEIRDRMAGGTASIPLGGTAVYMTPYSRLEDGRQWESHTAPRKWLYQTPIDILIKASNGASDFGNKFGQPLICGSVLTFEYEEGERAFGYDKVIMLAGGVGYGNASHSLKKDPSEGDRVIVLGGDNYRIGMGGGAVSSVATGEFDNTIELNAVQRSNPEMQKRVYNALRAMGEGQENPVISVHDHGAGGHLNCLSELVEEKGGEIEIGKLPVGDPTLSDKEIIGNESQERMGLVIHEKDLETLRKVAERERAPLYDVGKITGDKRLVFRSRNGKQNPIDLDLIYMFGSSPQTVLEDKTDTYRYQTIQYDPKRVIHYLEQVLQLEAVACKDWLTNKVDRSVTGRVAVQQTVGEVQLPLNNVAVMALDYQGEKGVATSIGHAPAASLIDPAAGSRLALAESLTNLVWAPVESGLLGVSLSANWMWPAKNPGENARLYRAVESVGRFAQDLGINIPTGKDSLSMTQKYPDGKTVKAPGTVIISSVAEVSDIRKVVKPALNGTRGHILYIDFSSDGFELGGSSFAQVCGDLGDVCPDVKDAAYFKKCFNAVQELITEDLVLAGHDISAGGMITALLEMCFPHASGGLTVDLSSLKEKDPVKILFSEKPGIIIQVTDIEAVQGKLKELDIECTEIGQVREDRKLHLKHNELNLDLDINELRDTWFRTSYLLEKHQTNAEQAESRFRHYGNQVLEYRFPKGFKGKLEEFATDTGDSSKKDIKAAIIREKGVNGDREMAYAMHLAGFRVKDIHMTDLISGREDLSDVNFIVFVGGFSNSDVLGSAKGWAGAFLYNPRAKKALDDFYARTDTLSLGVCNGCQLMMELDLLYPDMKDHPKMHHNASGKFESSFLTVEIDHTNAVMMQSLIGTRLGIWVAHGEGRFELQGKESDYNISGQYAYHEYPGNPNGSTFDTAIIASRDGRHLAMMPHLERSILPWQWAHYPETDQDVSPWILPFRDALKWIDSKVN